MRRFLLLSVMSLFSGGFLNTPLNAAIFSYQPALSVAATSSPRGVAVGDVYGNGVQCFVVANFGAPTFIGQNTPATLLNPTNSCLQVFSPAPEGLTLTDTIPTASSPRGVFLFDLFSRGRQDILTTAYDSNLLQVFGWQNGKFVKLDEKPTLKLPVGVTAGLTRPGGTAFAVVTDYGENQVSIFTVEDGKLGRRVDITVDAGPTQASIGDLNGDGLNEIAVVSLPANKIVLLAFPSTGPVDDPATYAVTKTLALPEHSGPADLRIADVNGDGLSDLVVAGFEKNAVFVYLQQKDGSLSLSSTLAISGNHPNGLTLADLNADGQPEIIVVSRDSDLIDIFALVSGQYQLVQTLKTADDSNSALGPVEIAVMDTTGNGGMDLVASHMRSNSIKILSQIVSETAGHPTPTPGGNVDTAAPFSEKTTFCFPNPSREGKATFSFTLMSPAKVEIKIFDVTGDLVWSRNLDASETKAGVNQIPWDCKNHSGESLASGLYLYRIVAEGKVVTKKIAIIH
jgi:hypothetical protein